MELFLGKLGEEERREKENYDLVIIGGGPAGLAAGIYAKRAGLNAIVIEKNLAGGLAAEAPLVENYPGFKSIEGKELARNLKEHALEYIEIREFEEVNSIKFINGRFQIITNKGDYECTGIILATGTGHKHLNVPGEKELAGKGVSYCVTCDGYLYKGKKVAVVGGGNSGAIAALYLKSIGAEPIVIEYMDRWMCEDAYRKRIQAEGIPYLTNRETLEIFGTDKVEGIRVRERKKGAEEFIEVQGVFIYVGLLPHSELAKELGVKLDEKKYVVTDRFQRTNVERFYAAGDVTGGVAQIIVAASQGAIAALSAYEDIKLKGHD